jgi:hypothetical protein
MAPILRLHLAVRKGRREVMKDGAHNHASALIWINAVL